MKIIQQDSQRLVFAPPNPSQRIYGALCMLLVVTFGIAVIVLPLQAHLKLTPSGPKASDWFSILLVSLVGVGVIWCAWRMRITALPYRLELTRQPPTAAYRWRGRETLHRTFTQPTAIVVMPAQASRGWPVGFLLEHGDGKNTVLFTSHERWATEAEALKAAAPIAESLGSFFECKVKHILWSPSLVSPHED